MNDHHGRYLRIRYTATGALAALAAAGAIAGTVALADGSPAKAGAGAGAGAVTTKSPRLVSPGAGKSPGPSSPGAGKSPGPSSPGAGKSQSAGPATSDEPFLDDVQQLVSAGTITAAEGQVLDGEIQAGGVDTEALAASGFTTAQLDAVQQALSSTKEAMATAARGAGAGSGG